MPDLRTRTEKLLAMATQDESPHERDVARAMLASEGMWPPPPSRPTAVAAPASEPWRPSFYSGSTSGTTAMTWVFRGTTNW